MMKTIHSESLHRRALQKIQVWTEEPTWARARGLDVDMPGVFGDNTGESGQQRREGTLRGHNLTDFRQSQPWEFPYSAAKTRLAPVKVFSTFALFNLSNIPALTMSSSSSWPQPLHLRAPVRMCLYMTTLTNCPKKSSFSGLSRYPTLSILKFLSQPSLAENVSTSYWPQGCPTRIGLSVCAHIFQVLRQFNIFTQTARKCAK
jgi:hypothetical protein